MKTKFQFISLLAACIILFGSSCQNIEPINRYELVNRHNILVEQYDSLASLSIGNGNFAFTTDLTGLQTFYKEYENGITLGTQSNWGWNKLPNSENFKRTDCDRIFIQKGREIPYRHQFRGNGRDARASEYFRENPHRLHLGLIRLIMTRKDGNQVSIKDITNPKHHLNLWQGRITSRFMIENNPVEVEVYCHQDQDMIVAKIKSPLIRMGQLAVQWQYPYGVPKNTHPGYDFDVPDKHRSEIISSGSDKVIIQRTLDSIQYNVAIQWSQGAGFEKIKDHSFRLKTLTEVDSIEFSCLFTPNDVGFPLPDFNQTKTNNLEAWEKFWKSGGAIDFSSCTDPRAHELERRVILSQYLTKIQSSGNLPPAETGLTYNSWYGKFHLEMHWWHSAHYPLWNRDEYLKNQMPYYRKIYNKAKYMAAKQGYKGIRWPKMVGPEGNDSPSSVGTYLIWQQPHYIYYAELLYRNNPTREVLDKYKDLVFATADFMADFAQLDTVTGIYNLLPPLIPAQELFSRETTTNPPFELAYWHWGLSTAQKWNERLGLPINKKWEDVYNHLATPTVLDNVYLGTANSPDSYTNPDKMRDHPVVLGSYGILPLWDKIDTSIMCNTMNVILEKWNWPTTWGWDYPMMAMCATRLGKPEIALSALFMNVQKNTYLINGHNYQSQRLRLYLPGNGGLLTSVSMMCAGWEGCKIKNPGFPQNGKWDVKWENLTPMF